MKITDGIKATIYLFICSFIAAFILTIAARTAFAGFTWLCRYFN